jgi:hypothetical protein
MPIATFRGEKTVADIADKMYLRLTPKQRKKAEAEILKANPQLNNLRAVPEGAIVRVPDLPELRPKTNRNLENPDTQIADAVSDALTALGTRFDARMKLAMADLKNQTSYTKDSKIKLVLGRTPELKEVLGATAKALAARTKALEARHDTLSAALKQAQADLQGNAKTKKR